MNMYVVVIITDTHLYRVKINGDKKYTIGSGKKDLFEMKELGNAQLSVEFIERKSWLKVNAKKIFIENHDVKVEGESVTVCEKPRISVRWTRDTGEFAEHYPIPYDCQIHIGRSSSNDVILKEQFISRKHLVITSDRGSIYIEDVGSKNGTWLNGVPIQKAALKSGDVIDILHLRIECRNSSLYFDNLHCEPTLRQIAGNDRPGMETKDNSSETNRLTYHRSPRIREALPSEPVTLSHVPNKPGKLSGRGGRWLSLLSQGAMLGVSVAMGPVSPAMLAMRAAMMVTPVGSMIAGSDRKARKMLRVEEEERFRKYTEYINGEKARIETIGLKQSEIINRENPAPELCRDILSEMTTALWERNPADSDFLQVRMGAGYAPLCVEVKQPSNAGDFHMERDELEELSNRIIQETRLVDNVAARADLMKYNSIGIIGTRSKVIALVKNMIISLTSLHYYKDVRIVGVFDPEEQKEWESLRWLPHFWDEDMQTRYLNFDPLTEMSLENTPIDESESHVDPYREFREKLGSIIAGRMDPDFQKKWKDKPTPLPHYVFIFGSRKKTECLLSALSANDPKAGISALYLYDEQYNLPSFCQYIVNVNDSYDENTATGFYKNRADQKMWFTMDPPASANTFEAFCRRMAAVEVEDTAGRGQIPTSLTFLQCMGVDKVQELNVPSRWEKNDSSRRITSPLGESEGGKLFNMSIHRHCSHGLVAGMTGSGKSELLVSWILSMACNYQPEDVSFVVIDYKGGSTAYAVEKLPHVCGIITDSGSGIDRCFQSLEHELRRREDLFAEAGVSDIKDYIKGHRERRIREPLPRLLIVFDEFKELIKERPAVKKMVNSIAAKGSSLGVHLVLATQNPADAVDEGTWNNTQYQICLKVQNAAASKVMIHEPDAAMITQAGRAYVRVGTSEKAEVFELIQSSWSGAPYRENSEKGGLEVRYVLMNGERLKTVQENKTRFVSDKREIDAVVSYIVEAAQSAGIEGIPSPWKPDVPDLFTWDGLPMKGGFDGTTWQPVETPWLSVPVGIYDQPELQMQGIQFMDFIRDGNFGIFGGPMSGKTSLLRTLAVTLCRMYSPRDVNLYIVGDMAGMAAFPQVGGVVGTGEEEKLAKLVGMLTDFLEERRRLFNREHVDSLKAYRELVSEEMPAVFVLIDRFNTILDAEQDYRDRFTRLFSEGPSKGIYFAYTGVNNSGVPYKLTANVSGAVSFMQPDKSEYSGLVGQIGDRKLPDRIGSALIRINRDLIYFQKAMYEPGQNDMEREISLKSEAYEMTKAWHGKGAPKIPVLPEYLPISEMVALTASEHKISVGLQADNVQPACVVPVETAAMAVTGRRGCGKTAMIRAIGQIVKEADEKTLLYCLDTQGKGLAGLQDFGARYALMKDEQATAEMFREILTELADRIRRKKQAPGEVVSEPWILLLIDNIKEFSEVSEEIQIYLHRILTKTKELGMFVICGIRQEELFDYYTQDQLGVDLKASGVALALSDTPAHYEGCYQNKLNYTQRSEEIKPGFGLFYSGGTCVKIKCVDL